jgi:beta-lactamase regulating signal transducer with metallopeptidase domain
MNSANPADLLARVLLASAISTAVLALVMTVSRSRRLFRDAAVRHAGWSTTFALLLLLPLFQDRLPALVDYRIARSAPIAELSAAPPAPARAEATAGSAARHQLLWDLVAFWSAGVVAVALSFAAGIATLVRLGARATDLPPGACDLPNLRRRVGLRRLPRLRVSTGAQPAAPLAWGWLRPVVLLPRGADRWDPARLEVVLLHELAHVRRGDNLSQLLALAACALHWFNPLFWLCARRMQADAEVACDDLVLCAGVRPSTYAAELLRFTAQLGGLPQPARLLASCMAARSTVGTRIVAIVDPGVVRERPRPGRVLATRALCLAAVCGFCAIRPSFAARPSLAVRPSLVRDVAPAGRDVVRTHGAGRSPDVLPGGARDEYNDFSRAYESSPSPDVLGESELARLRARRHRPVSPGADLVGSPESERRADKVGADRLPP